MAAGSVDSLSVGASLSLCSAHLCHICVCMAEHSHDSVMMVDRWILLSPRTATMWKNVNLTPLFIQIQNQKKSIILCHSLQVWQSPWGLSRDPEASAKEGLLLLWERTAGTLKGNTKNTATMLSSAIASPWTAASLTTDLKSTSTSSSDF